MRRGATTWEHCRPNAAAMFSIYALPPGIPIATVSLGGIGSPIPRPPIPGCTEVFIGSDSEGLFGRLCPSCAGYWRSDSPGGRCPYCGVEGDSHNFLTQVQQHFVKEYCTLWTKAIFVDEDGTYVIDLNAVADSVNSDQKPPFYYVEESQQK